MNYLRKLQYSLIISYLIVILIPLIALGLISFYISLSIVLNQTIEQDKANIYQISNNVDSVISRMNSTSSIIYSSTQLQDYISNENTDNMEVVGDLNIHKYLYSLKAIDFTNYTLILKSYASNIVYCNNYDYIIDKSFDFEKLDWIKKAQELNGSILFVPTYYPGYYKENKDPVFTVTREIIDNYNLRPLGFIIINCNASLIEDIVGESSGAIYIYDEFGNIVYPYKDVNEKIYEITGNEEILQIIDGEKHLVSEYISKSTKLKYVKITPYSYISKNSNIIIKTTVVTIAMTVILSLILSYYLSRRISDPINNLIDNMNSVKRGLNEKSVIKTKIFEIFELNRRFNEMMSRIHEHINREYLSQLRQKEIEFKVLQSQISPHFLFNTLDSIRMMAALNNDDESAKMIFNLASLYRYSIRMTNALVPLKNEIEHIYHYVELQKMRFGDRFEYVKHIGNNTLDCLVPPLILQPIIENCIYHGFAALNYIGLIELKTKMLNNKLTISITDNGKGIAKDKLSEINYTLGSAENQGHIGILATYERIKHHFKESNFIIESQEGIGTVVKIEIQY